MKRKRKKRKKKMKRNNHATASLLKTHHVPIIALATWLIPSPLE